MWGRTFFMYVYSAWGFIGWRLKQHWFFISLALNSGTCGTGLCSCVLAAVMSLYHLSWVAQLLLSCLVASEFYIQTSSFSFWLAAPVCDSQVTLERAELWFPPCCLCDFDKTFLHVVNISAEKWFIASFLYGVRASYISTGCQQVTHQHHGPMRVLLQQKYTNLIDPKNKDEKHQWGVWTRLVWWSSVHISVSVPHCLLCKR